MKITKRMISMILAVAMVISLLPISVLAQSVSTINPNTATEEELLHHRAELFDTADAAGFGVEYDLFYSVLEEMDQDDAFWAYDDFAAYCNGLSGDVLLTLLGYLRKFVAAGQVAGYSAASATEEFFQWEMYNIYYTYLIPGSEGTSFSALDLEEFETTPMFIQQMPSYFYYANPEDVPDELVLTVEVSAPVLTRGSEAVWVIAKEGHYVQQLMTEFEPDTDSQGSRFTLRLSADDILSCAANTNGYGERTGGYGGFYVRAVVAGCLSEPCYIAVGTDAFLQGSVSYGAKESGIISVDLNTDHLPAGTALSYEWRLSGATDVRDRVLEGEYDESMWQSVWTTQPTLTREMVVEALGDGSAWDNAYYASCTISWDRNGETATLGTPILPVFGTGDAQAEAGEPDWAFSPITKFEVFDSRSYLEPGTTVTSNAFTLADATIDCLVYYNRNDDYNDRVIISDSGNTFTVPGSAEDPRLQKEYCVEYAVTRADGRKSEFTNKGIFNVYPEGKLVYTGIGMYDELLGEDILHKYVPQSNSKSSLFTLEPMSMYQNGVLYSTGSSSSSQRITVTWYTNTVKSYEGATLHSTNSIAFYQTPDTLGDHFVYCVVTAKDFSYTSKIFTYTVFDRTALTENLYSITSDGTLYQVFSNNKKVVIPETVNGITVKTIGVLPFGTGLAGTAAYNRCPNMTELVLPDTVERLKTYAIPSCVTKVDLGSGLKYMEKDCISSLEYLSLPDSVEELYLPWVSTLDIQSVSVLEKIDAYLAKSNSWLSVDKLILPEGLEIIGEGGLDFEISVNELVLPSTLRVFKPVAGIGVSEKIEFPEGLEVYDGGLEVEVYSDPGGTSVYISTMFSFWGDTISFPESIKTFGHPGSLSSVTDLQLPDSFTVGDYSFFRSGMESYTLPADMTVIPDYLFYESQLREIIIPDGVTEIGEGAFANCGNLERIVIPASVTKIGKGAFQDCWSLQEVIIEGVLDSIEANAFKGCSSLTNIQIQDGLKRVEANAFQYCYGITSLDFLSDSVCYIGNNAFESTGLMGQIVLPDGVLSIGSNVFAYSQVESILLNDRLQEIGDGAFRGTYITEITIPDSVIRIGSSAFEGVSLERVTMGDNVVFIGPNAFYCTNLTEFRIPAKLTKLLRGVIAGTQISQIDLDPNGTGTITYVGPFAFNGTDIRSIVFPESVTYIGRAVCNACYDLESVVLPSHISRIRAESFYYCQSLTSVQITAALDRVDEFAFAQCTMLNGIALPDTLRIVGKSAFSGCTSLEIEKLPADLVMIEDNAFKGTRIRQVELDEKVTSVGYGTFQDCTELETVVLNDGLLTIGKYAFAGCAKLSQLTIPNSVDYIGDHFITGTAIEQIVLPEGLRFIPAFTDNTVIRTVSCASTGIEYLWGSTFAGCTNLEEADVYSGEWIGSQCFKDCVSLKQFHVYYKTKEIRDDAFAGCAALEHITFGGEDSMLESIGDNALSGCVSITELDLPHSLRTIGHRAFEKTSIRSVIVPSLVQSIGSEPICSEISGAWTERYGDSCFYDCPELERIVFTDREDNFFAIYAFAQYCPKLAEVYLPSSVGWMATVNGFDWDIYIGNKSCELEHYNEAMLPGYVPTAYYRYGVHDTDEDYSEWDYASIYKPGDVFYLVPFSSDYDQQVDYLGWLQEQADEYQELGFGVIQFPTLSEYIKPITQLSDFGIKVMAGDQDITDKVRIDWYVNWLEDNVLTTGAQLAGSALVCDTFRYRFTVTLDENYGFDYENYDSGEFQLQSSMDGQTIVVNLVEREKGSVEIRLPDEVKNDSSCTVSVLQTQANLLRELETQVVDGKITLQAAPSANLLVYVYCNGYYKYTGSVDAADIRSAMESGTACVLGVQMKKLPSSGTFTAKFSIYDILPHGVDSETMLDSFDGISVEIKNETRGTVCENYTLQFPYIIINEYESFFELTDALTITVTPDSSKEMYGFTAVLNPGSEDNYGSTEGEFTKYGALYITPTLPEESDSNKAVVQVFDAMGNRCSVDVVDDGELLIRRFADGAYTVTVSEQNYYLNAVERLTQFTSCGWTAGEDYFKEAVELTAPCCRQLDVTVPAAPSGSFLLKQSPYASKEYKAFGQWWNHEWPYYTQVTFSFQLDTGYDLRNTQLVLSLPSDMEIFHIYLADKEPNFQMVPDRVYYSDDGETVYYEYPIYDLAQTEGKINLTASLRYLDELVSFDKIKTQYCTATILTDATVDGITDRHYVSAGSVSVLDEQMLSLMVGVSHSPTVSYRKNIPVQVTAPAGSEVELYADGQLVAQGKVGYTGIAVLRYDIPFDWMWWEYEVYAVVRMAGIDLEYTTQAVSVEFNEDLATPVSVEGTIEILCEETYERIYPNEYDTENVVSVNFQTGQRKNIKIQSALEFVEGQTYEIRQTYRTRFDRDIGNEARKVNIVIEYQDDYGNTKEEYLPATYNEYTKDYVATKVIKVASVDSAQLLQILQLPTHMAVEWDTAVNATPIMLMPGQVQVMVQQSLQENQNPVQAMFSTELTPETAMIAMRDPVENDPLFAYYPAQLQADLISDYQYVQDYMHVLSQAFEESFGFSLNDIEEEDYLKLMSPGETGSIDESVTPESLRQQGFVEIQVYGCDAGVFMAYSENGFEVYDFGADFYMIHDTTSYIDVLDAYMPINAKRKMVTKALGGTADSDWDSLSQYVNGIHNEEAAKLIDETVDHYLDLIYNEQWANLEDNLANMLAEQYDDSWLSYMFGQQNPVLNYLKNSLAEGLSWAQDLPIIEDAFDFDWDKDRLINQYIADDGTPSAQVTEKGQQFLDNAEMTLLSSAILGTISDNIDPAELAAYTAQLLQPAADTALKNIGSNSLLKAYDVQHSNVSDIITTAASVHGAANSMVLDANTYTQYQATMDKGVSEGILKVNKVYDANDSTKLLSVQVQSNIKGVNFRDAYVLSTKMQQGGVEVETKIYRAIEANKDLVDWGKKVMANSPTARKAVKGFGLADKIMSVLTGALDATSEMSQRLKAIGKMTDAYYDYVGQIYELGELFAKVDEVYRATVHKDEEKMESFRLMPVFSAEMIDDFSGFNMSKLTMCSLEHDAAQLCGSKENFISIYEGQAFVWWPYTETVYYPGLDTWEESRVKYDVSTLKEVLSVYAGTLDIDLDQYFGDSKIYYAYEDIEYEAMLRTIRKDILQAMRDLNRLCDQYHQEIKLETAHAMYCVLSMFPFSPTSFVRIVGDSIADAAFLIKNNSAEYAHLFSKANTNQYNASVAKLNRDIERFEDLKSRMSTQGDDGKGNWYRGGKTYITEYEAYIRWGEMADKHWRDLKYYPSGDEFGYRWDQNRKSEGDTAVNGLVFTEEEAIQDWLDAGYALEEYAEYGMDCSDPLIDPAGFIYEAVLSNRVEGATVTIYYQDENGQAVPWDAEMYDQESVIITDQSGMYSWLTPPGNWKVVAQKDGYLTADSTNSKYAVDGWLPVPPPQLDVNIGLITTQAPQVVQVGGYQEGVLVEFSQYMDLAGFDGKVTLLVDGMEVPCKLTFTDREVSAADAAVYYGRKLMVSRQDGEPLNGNVSVVIDGSVKNYAGYTLGSDYTSGEMAVKQYVDHVELTYQMVTVKLAESVLLEGRLLDAYGNPVAGRRVVLSVVGTENAQLLNQIVYSDRNGYFTFSVKGTDLGFTVIRITPDDSGATADLTVCTEQITEDNHTGSAKSQMPEVTIENPDGTFRTEKITENGTITLLPGSKLLIGGTVYDTVGYSMTAGSEAPWRYSDYTVVASCIEAEDGTYRIVVRESGKTYSDVLELTVVIDRSHTHNIVAVSAMAPTCTAFGNTAHYTCTGCGMLFEDAQGTVVTDEYSVTIAPTHDDPVYTNNGDTHSVDYPCCDGLDVAAESHTFTDHVCVCGARDNGGWTQKDGSWYYIDPETNQPVTGIARVPYPTAPIDGITYGPNAEDVAYAQSKGQTFIDKNSALFVFDENGVFCSDLTGLTDDDRWAVNGQLLWHAGLVLIGEDYYYFIGDEANGGNMIATGDVYVNRNTTAFTMILGGVYTFGADGKLCRYHGITEVDGVLRYYENARLMMGNGLTRVDRNYIYVRSNGELVVNAEYYVPGNELDVAAGIYTFDGDGFLVQPISTDKDGVFFENGAWYYYEEGKIAGNKGMMAYNGGYIYVRSNGQLATGTYYVTNVPEELSQLFHLGQKVVFDENGYAQASKHGIVQENGGLYYYQFGTMAYNAGLVELADGYIYVRSNGQLATGKYWITSTNGIMEPGCYEFAADGYMVISEGKSGITEEDGGLYYYQDGVKLYGAGLLQLAENSYIYVRSNGQLSTGRYWITNTNGILEPGYYEFGADGYMRISDADGIVEENGVMYYYLEGKKQFGLGLVKLDENTFIYVRTNGELAIGSYWITNHNGLLPETIYEFSEDGTLTIG